MSEERTRKALASLYVGDDDAAWLITSTPSEAAEAIKTAIATDRKFVRFTLGNDSTWNGKPLYIDPRRITAVSPPKSQDGDES